jgi:MFS family permease
MKKNLSSNISPRSWIVMAALALTGQIAWAVENAWFNTFVYDNITPDPRPVAWLKDLLPEQSRGKFLGIRMIFWIAIPMVVGPWLGSTLIQNFGIPTITNGEAGFIPVPIIFQVGSVIALLSLLPLGFTRREKSA